MIGTTYFRVDPSRSRMSDSFRVPRAMTAVATACARLVERGRRRSRSRRATRSRRSRSERADDVGTRRRSRRATAARTARRRARRGSGARSDRRRRRFRGCAVAPCRARRRAGRRRERGAQAGRVEPERRREAGEIDPVLDRVGVVIRRRRAGRLLAQRRERLGRDGPPADDLRGPRATSSSSNAIAPARSVPASRDDVVGSCPRPRREDALGRAAAPSRAGASAARRVGADVEHRSRRQPSFAGPTNAAPSRSPGARAARVPAKRTRTNRPSSSGRTRRVHTRADVRLQHAASQRLLARHHRQRGVEHRDPFPLRPSTTASPRRPRSARSRPGSPRHGHPGRRGRARS